MRRAGELEGIPEESRGSRGCAKPFGAGGHGEGDERAQWHELDTSGMHGTRPEHTNGVATMQGMGFYVAKDVHTVVLRTLITVV